MCLGVWKALETLQNRAQFLAWVARYLRPRGHTGRHASFIDGAREGGGFISGWDCRVMSPATLPWWEGVRGSSWRPGGWGMTALSSE